MDCECVYKEQLIIFVVVSIHLIYKQTELMYCENILIYLMKRVSKECY